MSEQEKTFDQFMIRYRNGDTATATSESLFDLTGFHVGDRIKWDSRVGFIGGLDGKDLVMCWDDAREWNLSEFVERKDECKLLFSPYEQGRRHPKIIPKHTVGEYGDVTFVLAQKEEVKAYRGLLSCNAFFRAMLCGSFSESQSARVELPTWTKEEFTIVLDILYNRQLPNFNSLDMETKIGLIEKSFIIQMPLIASTLSKSIDIKAIPLDNLESFWRLVTTNDLHVLTGKCLTFMSESLFTMCDSWSKESMKSVLVEQTKYYQNGKRRKR